MNKIPLLPIGRAIIAEMKNVHNSKGYTIYLQAHRKTILNFENSFSHYLQNGLKADLETAIIYHWNLVTDALGNPMFASTTFPARGFCGDGLDDFNRILASVSVFPDIVTRLMVFESDSFLKIHKKTVFKWFIYYNASEINKVILSPIIANDKISQGKVFLKQSN